MSNDRKILLTWAELKTIATYVPQSSMTRVMLGTQRVNILECFEDMEGKEYIVYQVCVGGMWPYPQTMSVGGFLYLKNRGIDFTLGWDDDEDTEPDAKSCKKDECNNCNLNCGTKNKPANNDGRDTCAWCGAPTRDFGAVGGGMSMGKVCTKCGK